MEEKKPTIGNNAVSSSANGNGKRKTNGHSRGRKVFEFKINLSPQNLIFYFLIGLLVVSSLVSFSRPLETQKEIPLSQALNDIKSGNIKEVALEGDKITLLYGDNKTAISYKEQNESLVKILETAGIDPKNAAIKIKDQAASQAWLSLISNILPLGLMAVFFLFLMKQAKGAQDNLFSFGASKAKLFTKDLPKVTFNDVAGVDEAKQELAEIVDFLRHPEKYEAVGARTPKGVLLVGPSGSGKTLLARALAGEAKVPFFSMAGSEFMEMLVGVGASVTGDTPVLVKENNQCRLLPISEIVDKFYENEKSEGVKKTNDLKTLGFVSAKNGFWGTKSTAPEKFVFKNSAFQKVSAVYRHKIKEIYEIEYLDGKICATGDHSVFIRTSGWIKPVAVRDLKPGDILMNLPINTRRWDKENKRTEHKIKAHDFFKSEPLFLDFWNEDENEREKYDYAIEQKGEMSQRQIAAEIGVSQATVGNWQNNIYRPQKLSRKLVKMDFPDKIETTADLLKLFGYYTAEGRGEVGLEMTFGAKETDLHKDFISLMKKVFGVEASKAENTSDNSTKIIYYSKHLGRFFIRFCGNGAHQKHIPPFLWEMPAEYFLSYLKGFSLGDGYITKEGKLSMTSVSKQLINELAWLCAMHGIKCGIKHEILPGGRIIKSKPLPSGESWVLIIGKTSNPFLSENIKRPYQIKRCLVKKIVKKSYDGWVYDLCGIENEGFFGGEKPVLLHNSRVRDLFSNAKKSAPSIIFIDEIESIGRARSMFGMTSHDEREQTLNQILVEMDGFSANERVLVAAATNRPDLLDPALTRPGRFDRKIMLELPDIEGRKAILAIHGRGKPFGPNVSWEKVAKRTVGFSGADLENMLNEAAILAARQARKIIEAKDLEEAATKVKLGPEKKRLQSDEDKKMTAYHEAGHAVIAFNLPHMDPVHRISIVSRGMALGFTLIPPEKDRLHETQTHLLEAITSMLGGRAAEEIVFQEFTSGAASDIDQATSIARSMVLEFGMSKLGPINFGPTTQQLDWGKQWLEQAAVSQKMQAAIDEEIKKIIGEAYQRAMKILKENRKKLDLIAAELLKKETIEGDEFARLMKG